MTCKSVQMPGKILGLRSLTFGKDDKVLLGYSWGPEKCENGYFE